MGAALIGVGIVSGIEVQKELGTSSGSSASAFPAISGLPLTTGSGASLGSSTGAGAVGNPFRSTTVGTVTLVDGSNVYVTTSSGKIVKVLTKSSTSVQVSKNESVADLQPGQSVVVEGKKDAAGSVVATSISEGSTGISLGSGG